MTSHQIGNEVLKSAPPVAVVSAAVAGMQLDDWVKVITIIYVALQIIHLLFVRSWRKKDSE